MTAVRVFDPAMCCSTGVCGPSVDPQLARFSADLDWLTSQGVAVERFNLAQQPAAFRRLRRIDVPLLPFGLVGVDALRQMGTCEIESPAAPVATAAESAAYGETLSQLVEQIGARGTSSLPILSAREV